MKTLVIIALSLATLYGAFSGTENTRETLSSRDAQIESILKGAE
jgi:hypothetical protein